MSDLLSKIVVPVASEADAVATYESLNPYVSPDTRIHLINIIQKAGGAPDKAGVEQRQEVAADAFESFEYRARADDIPVETEIVYATDVAEGIWDVADSVDASAIVFRSRGGGRIVDFLSGGVRTQLIQESDWPVIVLPQVE